MLFYWTLIAGPPSARVERHSSLGFVWHQVARTATEALLVDVAYSEPQPGQLAAVEERARPGEVWFSARFRRHLTRCGVDKGVLADDPGAFERLLPVGAPAGPAVHDPWCRTVADLAVALELGRAGGEGREEPPLPPAIRGLFPSESWPDLYSVLDRSDRELRYGGGIAGAALEQLRAWVVACSSRLGRILTRDKLVRLLRGSRLSPVPGDVRDDPDHRAGAAAPGCGTDASRVAAVCELVDSAAQDQRLAGRLGRQLRSTWLAPVQLLALHDDEFEALPLARGSLDVLRRWVSERTAAFGHPLTLDEVRAVLRHHGGRPASGVRSRPDSILGEVPAAVRSLPVALLGDIGPRVRNWFRRAGVAYIGDLGSWTEACLKWEFLMGRVSIRLLQRRVENLQARVRRADVPPGASVADYVRRLLPAPSLLETVGRGVAEQDEPERSVLARRTFSSAPDRSTTTYAALARQLDLTPTRCKAAEERGLRRLDGTGILRCHTDAILFELRRARRRPLTLPDLERADPWFAGVASQPVVFQRTLAALNAEHRVGGDAGHEYVSLAVAAPLPALAALVAAYADPQTLPEADTPEPGSLPRALAGLGVAELEPLLRPLVATETGPSPADCARAVLADLAEPLTDPQQLADILADFGHDIGRDEAERLLATAGEQQGRPAVRRRDGRGGRRAGRGSRWRDGRSGEQ